MDGKSETTQERGLIKTNFTMGKGTRLLILPRKTNSNLIKKLKPIPEPPKSISFQRTLLFKGMKQTRCIRGRRMKRRGYQKGNEGGGVCPGPNWTSTRRQANL